MFSIICASQLLIYLMHTYTETILKMCCYSLLFENKEVEALDIK